MPKISLSDLEAIRKRSRAALVSSSTTDTIKILVGLGTCGVAAGARATFAAFNEECAAAGVTNVAITQTGCIGQCQNEPTVEVCVPGMPPVIYGKVDAATAKTIVRKHVVEKALVDGHIFDRPSPDVIG